MRGWGRALYWLVAGALVGFGFVGIFSIGSPFLLLGLLMGAFGLRRFGFDRAWAVVVGSGALPALVFLANILGAAITNDPSCSGARAAR